MKCENCDMFIYDGPILTTAQLEGKDLVTGDETLAETEHVCPEPYSLDIAQSLIEFHSSSKIPMHPRDYARCVLAYRAAGVGEEASA